MPIIQIPLLEELRKAENTSANGSERQPSSAQASLFPVPTAPPAFDDRTHKTPFGLLDDDLELQLERSKLREAFWISLIVHGVMVALVIWLFPKLLIGHQPTPSALAKLLQDHQITFLELPSTPSQKPLDTNKISDQDRRAALRHPDLQQLRELEEARRAGSPEAMQAPAVRTPPPGQQAQPNQQQQAAQAQPQQQPQQQPDNTTARLEQPQMPPRMRNGANNPFATATAGSVIEQAARNSAERQGYSATTGEYGMGPSAQQTKLRNDVDIVSDTMGVDFGPYLKHVVESVREHWYDLIPEEARAPLMKSGKVSIEFAINKDGSVAGMRLISPSGDVALDRAAWGGITGSNPFQPLPQEFRGQYLALRFHFFYNPQKNDLR